MPARRSHLANQDLEIAGQQVSLYCNGLSTTPLACKEAGLLSAGCPQVLLQTTERSGVRTSVRTLSPRPSATSAPGGLVGMLLFMSWPRCIGCVPDQDACAACVSVCKTPQSQHFGLLELRLILGFTWAAVHKPQRPYCSPSKAGVTPASAVP